MKPTKRTSKMLAHGYAFDTVQMPLNCFDANFRSFEKAVLPELVRRGIGCLGMKPLTGKGAPIKANLVTPKEMLSYAMSLPGVAVTITGMESVDRAKQNVEIARGFKALDEKALRAIRDKCAGTAADKRYELYNVSLKYDNPEARRAHGFPIDSEQMEVKELLHYAAGKGSAK